MKGHLSSRYLIGLLLALWFLFPYLTLSFYAPSWSWPELEQTSSVFGSTFLQALLSATASLVFGIIGSLGLIWLSQRFGQKSARIAEAISLLPNAAPVILMLLATMKFLPWARGLSGIVLVHTLLNSGLVAVTMLYLMTHRIGGMAELAWVEGASGFKFFFHAVLKYLKTEIFLVFFFVFAICFSSFAVPLMLGGARATTVEVLIYQKIRVSGDWGQAISLAILQAFVVFALTLILRSKPMPQVFSQRLKVPLLGWKWGVVFAIAPAILLFAGLMDQLNIGFQRLFAITPLMEQLPSLFLGSVFVAGGTGTLTVIFLLLISFSNPQGFQRKLLLGYAAPSSVLMGFAVLILWRATGFASYLKIIIGLTLVTLPAFYRLRWDSVLGGIEAQRVVAKTLGATEGLIFQRVVFPQVISSACALGALSAVWAWGDFALSSVVAERSITLAMVARGLMESYRLDAATALIWFLIIGAGVTFIFFTGVGRVLGSKSLS